MEKLREFQLSENAILARNPRNNQKMVLPGDVVNAMSYCQSFRTLDEHVSHLMEGGDGAADRKGAIRSVVESVRAGGLTLSARELSTELEPVENGALPVGKPIVVIITCDRPLALERVLESLLAECDLEQVDHCYVIDDSKTEPAREINAAITRQYMEQANGRITYFGPSAAGAFMSKLIRQLPDREKEIRFLLDPGHWQGFISTGVSRNYSQLLSVGKPALVLDDDAVCKIYSTDFSVQGNEFSEGRRQAHFFQSHEEQERFRITGQSDPIRQHMRCLGLSVPNALHALGSRALDQQAFRHAQPEFVSRLNRHSRILVTECGSFGDPGSIDYLWLGALPEETLERLVRDESQADLAIRHSQCFLGVSRPTISSAANFSQMTGLDNRDFLPPYFPIERGQDLIFGETTRFIFPDSACLIYPWAILHLRVDNKRSPASRMASYNPQGYPGSLTRSPPREIDGCLAEQPLSRLAYLASSYRDLGASSQKTIMDLCAEHSLQQKSAYLSKLRQSLDKSSDGSPAWINYLRESIRQTKEDMEKDLALTRVEKTAEQPGRDQLIRFWKEAWDGFGQALVSWPEIRAVAKSLGDEAGTF